MAGTLVVFTQAFSLATAAWLVFAFGCGFTVVSLTSAVMPTTLVQRAIGAIATVIGAWTIVESLVFSPATATWIGFADALGILGLALIGLMVHELRTERVVHALEIREHSPVATERADARHRTLA
jgi:hypothetical protein